MPVFVIDAPSGLPQDAKRKMMKDVTEVMGMGWLSIIVDPTGAALGLWKAKPRTK